MIRQEKAEKVAQLQELFKQSGACFVTDYQGLNVADLTVLRKNLRNNKVKLIVAKNTLFRVAAKILHDSFKEKQLPRFKVFVVEGQIHQADEIKMLAELPPRTVLLAQVVAAVESPLTSLVGTLDGFFRELIGVIDALETKKKSEAA